MQAGKRFRIYAPPGISRHGRYAGSLSLWVGAGGSRCLFGGYRYEAPLAGVFDYPSSDVIRRQDGKNFAGQHYTLYRHFDPYLMRFTTPDPIAAEFWNLNSYAGNSPARFYDPDGLMMKNGRSSNPLLDALGLWGFGDKIKDWMDDNLDPGPTAADWAFENADEFQLILGGLGMTPIVGEVFDLFNMMISLARGNYGDAALDAASMIPFLGNIPAAAKLVTRGGKVLKKVVKYGDDAADLSAKVVSKSDDVATGRMMSFQKTSGRLGAGTAAETKFARDILEEAATNSGKSLSDLVDDVVVTAGDSMFHMNRDGKLIIQLNRGQLAKGADFALRAAYHELGHAIKYSHVRTRVFRGNRGKAWKYFTGKKRAWKSSAYAKDELLSERFAARMLNKHHGGMSPQLQWDMMKYGRFWKGHIAR